MEKTEKERDEAKKHLHEKTEEAEKAHREIVALSHSLKIFQESKVVLGEQLLGQLHELVSDVTKDIEMTEDQEAEYQRLMGAMDEALKSCEVQKLESVERYQESEKAKAEAELKLEDLEEKFKLVEEQNTLLRDQAKEAVEKQRELKVIKNDEFELIEKEIARKEEIIINQTNEASKAIARAKDLEEELSELKSKFKKQQEELKSMAITLAEKLEAMKLLENKYTHVKEKYAELREGSIKKYEARYNSKVKELEAKMAAKLEENTKLANEVATVIEAEKEQEVDKAQGEADELHRLRSEVASLTHQIEILKTEAESMRDEKQVRDEQIHELERIVDEFKKKKSKLDDTGDLPKKQAIESSPDKNLPAPTGPTLNPKRILQFLEGIDTSTRTLYKEFILYGSSKPTHDPQVDEMQMKMNQLVEQANDFKDYVKAKTQTLAK